MMRQFPWIVLVLALVLPSGGQVTAGPPAEFLATIVDDEPNPLPRFRTPAEMLLPLPSPTLEDYLLVAPPAGTIRCVAEYEPMQGALVRWGSFNSLLTEFIVGIAQPTTGLTAYVLVTGAGQQASATSTLAGAGADMNYVEFITYSSNSVWIRDYGPRYIWQDGTRAIVDHVYNRPRPLDDVFPLTLAELWYEPVYDLPLVHGGGNFHLLSTGEGFTTTLVENENPALMQAEIADFYREFQNIDPLTIYPRLPSNIDSTGHIDMWMCPISDTEFVIAEFPDTNPDYPAYVITEDATADLISRGYTVYRVPGLNSGANGYNGVHYTYTNAVIINDLVFVPYYGGAHASRDSQALAVWQAAMPGHTIIPVNCAQIIPSAGAVHCVMMHVPAYTDQAPSACVLSPDGGEVWGVGQKRSITWAANDNLAVTSVDIHYSTDGGATFPHVIATGEPHDGFYLWMVPATVSNQCRVKVVAHDADLNTGEGISHADFSIASVRTHIYDFSASAGVDRWAYGTYSDSWSSDLESNREPAECMTEISAVQSDAYARLAYSDATGSSSDPDRFTNPDPGSGDESTLRAEFTIQEDPATIVGMEFLWEGFGGGSAQMELYVWDDVAGNWSDGLGRYGENRYIDASRANNDFVLRGRVDSDLERYINSAGILTLLVYCDVASRSTYHDYLQLVVYEAVVGDFDADGDVDLDDFSLFAACFNGSARPPSGACPPGIDADLDGDGDVDLDDFASFAANFTGSL